MLPSIKTLAIIWLALGIAAVPPNPVMIAQDSGTASQLRVVWNKATVSKSTATLQLVVNPIMLPGAKMHDSTFAALHELGADYVRYVPWFPYPRLAVAELEPPQNGKTSWDFSRIDPAFDDFMRATAGHSVIVNFSTIPAWMFKTAKPVAYPEDPNQTDWDYTQGTELRDPSMKEVVDYYARLLSWYTRGGFTDEYGKRHESGHHYKIAYWEILNEINFEHHWTSEMYTRFYDAVTEAMLKIDTQLKFVGLALARPGFEPRQFEYFLNPANHRKGAPLDFISYHFYANPSSDQDINDWQYTFFDQADGFLSTVRYIESLREKFSPSTRTDLDEVGVILPDDRKDNRVSGYIEKEPPAAYWNASGAVYAYLYLQCARLGIDVLGESQLVGYHTQFPSVSMMNYETSQPNARFWILKLIKDNFGPGDQLARTFLANRGIVAQAFLTSHGKKVLVVNKRNRIQQVQLPPGVQGSVTFVAPSTGDTPPQTQPIQDNVLSLQPFEVAVVSYR